MKRAVRREAMRTQDPTGGHSEATDRDSSGKQGSWQGFSSDPDNSVVVPCLIPCVYGQLSTSEVTICSLLLCTHEQQHAVVRRGSQRCCQQQQRVQQAFCSAVQSACDRFRTVPMLTLSALYPPHSLSPQSVQPAACHLSLVG